MSEGAPDWIALPARATSASSIGETTLRMEIAGNTARLRIEGEWHDEVSWTVERRETLVSIASLEALCATLATGEEHGLEEPAWGRVYPTIWSFAPHGEQRAAPEDPVIWRYPMAQDRTCLRLAARPLVQALREQVRWARGELALPALDRCLRWLDRCPLR